MKTSNEPKFPISDADMAVLLEKYPFLRFGSEVETCGPRPDDVDANYYKYWDGHGWEDLWKNRYLKRLFVLYDSWPEDTRKAFRFAQVKEKFGGLRIYTSIHTGDEDLETKAEMLSEWVCCQCGKEERDPDDGKRVHYCTNGWISYFCRECAEKWAMSREDLNKKINSTGIISRMYEKREAPFGYTRGIGKNETRIRFAETFDGWLERGI